MEDHEFQIKTPYGTILVLRQKEYEKNQELRAREFAEIIAKLLIENEKQKPI